LKTSVLIYAFDIAELKQQQTATLRRVQLWKSRRGRITFQVLRERFGPRRGTWWRPGAVDAAFVERS